MMDASPQGSKGQEMAGRDSARILQGATEKPFFKTQNYSQKHDEVINIQ